MTTQTKVIAIIAEMAGKKPQEITCATTLKSLPFDSLDKIEAVMALEEAFRIDMDDEEIEHFTDVQSVVDCVEKVLKEK